MIQAQLWRTKSGFTCNSKEQISYIVSERLHQMHNISFSIISHEQACVWKAVHRLSVCRSRMTLKLSFRHWAVCYTSGCLGSLGTLLPGAGSKFPGSDAAKKPRSQTGAPPCFTVGEDVHWPQSSASVVCFFPSHYPSDQPSISGFFVFTSMEVGYCPMNLRLFYDVGNSGFLKVVL